MTNANPQQKPSPPVGHNSQGANSGGIIVTLVIDVGEGGGNIGAETCRLLHHPTPLDLSKKVYGYHQLDRSLSDLSLEEKSPEGVVRYIMEDRGFEEGSRIVNCTLPTTSAFKGLQEISKRTPNYWPEASVGW